jgi:hypothetical protein
MATPADRELALEVMDERIRRWKLCQKLTEQAEAWAERRRMTRTYSETQKINQETNVTQTERISNFKPRAS